jgi:hypothetical protein
MHHCSSVECLSPLLCIADKDSQPGEEDEEAVSLAVFDSQKTFFTRIG